MKLLSSALVFAAIILLAGCDSSEEANQKVNIAYNAEQRFDVSQYQHNPNTDPEDQNGLWLALGKHTTEEGKQYFLRTLVKVDDTQTPAMQSCGYHLPHELAYQHFLKNMYAGYKGDSLGLIENSNSMIVLLRESFFTYNYSGITPHLNIFNKNENQVEGSWAFTLNNPLFQTTVPNLSTIDEIIDLLNQMIMSQIESYLRAFGSRKEELSLIAPEYTVDLIKLNDQIPSSIGSIGEGNIDCFTEFMTIEDEETHFAIELQETGKRFIWLQDNSDTSNVTMTDVDYEGAEYWIGDTNSAVLPAETTQVITTIIPQTNHPYFKHNDAVPRFLQPMSRLEKVTINYAITNLLSTQASLQLFKTNLDAVETTESTKESTGETQESSLLLDSEFSFEINLSSFENEA